MSYCVNCGVKLDPSLDRCPLCNTPVINPNEVSHTHPVPPFPREKGQVEVVKSKDLAILLSVSLTATAAVCGLLNLFVFSSSPWSLYVIGACLFFFNDTAPTEIYTRMPIYVSLFFDGLAAGLYEYLISFNTADNGWFFRLALPLTALVTAEAILFAFLIRRVSSAFLMTGLYFFVEVGILCAGIELFIRNYLFLPPGLSWAALVLAVCAVIVIALLTILSRSRLRNAVRRRLHF